MRLTERLQGFWNSTRAWAFIGALSTRGTGFIASFSLARFTGAEPLALYVTTLVTAVVVATPMAQIILNGGTLVASAAPSAAWARRLIGAALRMCLVCLPLLVLVYVLMHRQISNQEMRAVGAFSDWLVLAGLISVLSQVVGSALTGLLNGLGAQLFAARLTAMQSAILMPLSLPCVYVFGLSGALVMLVLASLLPLVLQLWLLTRWLQSNWQPGSGELHREADSPWRLLLSQAKSGMPNAFSLVAGGLVSWFCTIYLVQKELGTSAVALLAVATQWTTLVLMPATSWSALVLRELALQRLHPDINKPLIPTLARLMLRNVVVTGAVGGLVLLAWHWIELGYRLQGSGLFTLMTVSLLGALISSANGVLERALITWQKQWHLMGFAFVGFVAQMACTVAFISSSIAAVQWGLVLSALLVGSFSLGYLRHSAMRNGLV